MPRLLFALAASILLGPAARAGDSLELRFNEQVRPFVERYCVSCHGGRKPKGDFDLSRQPTVEQWGRVLERLRADEMPPEDASRRPAPGERQAVVAWIRELRDREARRQAGDPGPVFARRL